MIDRKLLMRWDQRIWYIWTTSKPWNHWLIQLIMRLWKLNSSLVVTYAMLSRICFFLRWSDHNVWLSDYTEWLMNGEFSSKNRHQSYILSPTMRHIVRISLSGTVFAMGTRVHSIPLFYIMPHSQQLIDIMRILSAHFILPLKNSSILRMNYIILSCARSIESHILKL